MLILVVLAQNSKGGGVSSQFGGSSTSQIMGVKKTGDLLERITWGFAIALMVLTLATNFMVEDNIQTEGFTSPNVEEAQESGVLPEIEPLGDPGDAGELPEPAEDEN